MKDKKLKVYVIVCLIIGSLIVLLFIDGLTSRPVLKGKGVVTEKWFFDPDRDLYDFVIGINKKTWIVKIKYKRISDNKYYSIDFKQQYHPIVRKLEIADSVRYFENIGKIFPNNVKWGDFLERIIEK